MLIAPSLRHAARRLARTPSFSVAAALTLMLGIGATTAVFSVVNAVLLRPLAYTDPDRLVDLSHTLAISGVSRVDQSDATYLYYRRANRAFTGVGAYRVTGVNVGRVAGASEARDAGSERVAAGRVSASTFTVLGVAPLSGRAFGASDDQPASPPVVVIGERLWARKFVADPSIVGRELEIDGVAHRVVGVMPARFGLPAARTELWLPLRLDETNTRSAAFDYRGVARLRDGVSIDVAAADLQRLLPRVPDAFPGRLTAGAIEQTRMQAVVRPLRDVVVGDVGRILWVVLGAAAAVLLVACANVMNLFLVRAEGRQHEMAIRRALGAGGGALVRDHLAEGMVLALIGGVLALGLAVAGIQVLRSLEGAIDIPRLAEVRFDGSVLMVAGGLVVLAVALVTALPAMRLASATAVSSLNEAGRALTPTRGRHRARHALVIVQMALALVLVSAAGLMARSFARLRSVPTGFDAKNAFAFRVTLPSASYAAPTDPARFIARGLEGIAAVPGVQSAGVVSKMPLAEEARRDTALFVEDRPLVPGRLPNVHQVAYTSPGYFPAIGIRLVEGRLFDSPDPDRATREVIVSRALADRYWPSEPVVGKRVRMAPVGAWYTIIGVAANVRGTALEQPPDEMIYLPLVTALGSAPGGESAGPLWSPRDLAFVVRGDRDPAPLVARVTAAVHAIDPAVPTYGGRTMTAVVASAAARTSFTLLLLGVASAVALALGAVGIYGVISYVVSLRTREIAVRLALGAQPADVRRMVSRQVLTVSVIGIVVGLVSAIALARVLGALLFGVSATDPTTLLGAAALLAGVSVGASWIPARRAASLDPAQALRAD